MVRAALGGGPAVFDLPLRPCRAAGMRTAPFRRFPECATPACPRSSPRRAPGASRWEAVVRCAVPARWVPASGPTAGSVACPDLHGWRRRVPALSRRARGRRDSSCPPRLGPLPPGSPWPRVRPARRPPGGPVAPPSGPLPGVSESVPVRRPGAARGGLRPPPPGGWSGQPPRRGRRCCPRPPPGPGLRLVPMLLLCVFAGAPGHRHGWHRHHGAAGREPRPSGPVRGARRAPRPPVRRSPVFAGSGCCGSALHGVTAWTGRKPLVKRGCPRQDEGGPDLRGEHCCSPSA